MYYVKQRKYKWRHYGKSCKTKTRPLGHDCNFIPSGYQLTSYIFTHFLLDVIYTIGERKKNKISELITERSVTLHVSVPAAAPRPWRAVSLDTAEPPGWELAVGVRGSGTAGLPTTFCTDRPTKNHTTVNYRHQKNDRNPINSSFSIGACTWFVYIASSALLNSMAWSCFLASLYSTPSALISFTFFLESNTFWSCWSTDRNKSYL